METCALRARGMEHHYAQDDPSFSSRRDRDRGRHLPHRGQRPRVPGQRFHREQRASEQRRCCRSEQRLCGWSGPGVGLRRDRLSCRGGFRGGKWLGRPPNPGAARRPERPGAAARRPAWSSAASRRPELSSPAAWRPELADPVAAAWRPELADPVAAARRPELPTSSAAARRSDLPGPAAAWRPELPASSAAARRPDLPGPAAARRPERAGPDAAAGRPERPDAASRRAAEGPAADAAGWSWLPAAASDLPRLAGACAFSGWSAWRRIGRPDRDRRFGDCSGRELQLALHRDPAWSSGCEQDVRLTPSRSAREPLIDRRGEGGTGPRRTQAIASRPLQPDMPA
jgi:hypothetical protein